jgi:hypothetical protein
MQRNLGGYMKTKCKAITALGHCQHPAKGYWYFIKFTPKPFTEGELPPVRHYGVKLYFCKTHLPDKQVLAFVPWENL